MTGGERKWPDDDELVERLQQLASAVAEGNRDEFTMRVPANPKRDADLILTYASWRLRDLVHGREFDQLRIEGLEDRVRALGGTV